MKKPNSLTDVNAHLFVENRNRQMDKRAHEFLFSLPLHFDVLCLPIIDITQDVKETKRKWLFPFQPFCFPLQLLFFSCFSTSSPLHLHFNLPSALQWSTFIGLCCHLTFVDFTISLSSYSSCGGKHSHSLANTGTNTLNITAPSSSKSHDVSVVLTARYTTPVTYLFNLSFFIQLQTGFISHIVATGPAVFSFVTFSSQSGNSMMLICKIYPYRLIKNCSSWLTDALN